MKKYSLSEYVKYRTGVALGAKGSLVNVFKRSFGAGSIQEFWQYWNPIWGYYLAILIYHPSRKFLPKYLDILITFLVSGLIHDFAVWVFKGKFSLLITLMFLFFSLGLIISEVFKINYSGFSLLFRIVFNLMYLSACVFLAVFTMN
jgi:hypothetical protein